jgi:hypothetical protein
VRGSSEHLQQTPTKRPRSEDLLDQQKMPGKRGRSRGRPRKKPLQNSQVPPYSFNDGDPQTSNHMDSQINIPTIPTDNHYAQLNEDEHQEMDQQQTPTKSAKAKSQKLPPIVLKNVPLQTVQTIMGELKITKYNFKFMSIGIKIYLESSDDLTKLKTRLSEKNFSYFTYQSVDEILVKYVIYGLNTYSSDEVRNELSANNIHPKNITMLNLRKKRYDDECIYLLYFKKGDTNINALRKVKSLFHTIVHWDHFVSKRNGPSQCRKCLMFGHSSYNCNVTSKCIRCGDQHESASCPHIQEGHSRIPDNMVKCANCAGNHTANFSKCPKRLDYINIKDQINQRNSKTPPKRTKDSTISHRLSTNQFPLLGQTQSGQTIQFRNVQNTRIPMSQKENPLINLTNNTNNHNNMKTYADVAGNNFNQNFNDLFTVTECIQIMTEMTSGFRNCRTKSDQLMVIANITMKYLCNGR